MSLSARQTGMVLIGWALLIFPALGDTRPSWSMVWADEFDQPDGSGPDLSKWVFDLGGGGWGNNELQTYTDRRVNARVEGGSLVIEARKETFAGQDGLPRDYTSARLKTLGKAEWLGGRIEARIKLPQGPGVWPAFWMLGTNLSSVGWPACGEIDIMENIGREPSVIHATIHGPDYSGGRGIGGSHRLADNIKVSDTYHVFAVEWQTNEIRWFMDERQYFRVTPERLPEGSKWVFDQPHHLLLNVAIGGNWPGQPDDTTRFPQLMLVDYVRVYMATNIQSAP